MKYAFELDITSLWLLKLVSTSRVEFRPEWYITKIASLDRMVGNHRKYDGQQTLKTSVFMVEQNNRIVYDGKLKTIKNQEKPWKYLETHENTLKTMKTKQKP